MPMKTFHSINAPLYLYLAMLTLYLSLRGIGDFVDTEWNEYAFNFLFFIAPFLTLFAHITLYRILAKKTKDIFVFIFAAIPGFFPGAIFGYGLWDMGHGDTMAGFLFEVFYFGLPTAFAFGLLGLIYNYIYIGVMRVAHKV